MTYTELSVAEHVFPVTPPHEAIVWTSGYLNGSALWELVSQFCTTRAASVAYRVLCEAVDNALTHAGTLRRMGQEEPACELTARMVNGRIEFTVRDWGVGLRGSLISECEAGEISHLSDAEFIEAVASRAISATGRLSRGCGLASMLLAIEQLPKGKLTIASQCGVATWLTGRKTQTVELEEAVSGVLVQLSFTSETGATA